MSVDDDLSELVRVVKNTSIGKTLVTKYLCSEYEEVVMSLV